MELKINKIKLSNISRETSLRCDFSYHNYINECEEYYSFDDLCDYIFNSVDVNQLNLINYCQIGDTSKDGDIEPVELDFDDQNIAYADYFSKIKKNDIQSCELNEILLSSVRPNLKKFIRINDSKKDVYFTKAFIGLRPKLLKLILYYSFRNIFYNDIISVSRTGKSYPTIKYEDLRYIRFNKKYIDKLINYESKINKEIIKIEKEINKLRKQQIPQYVLINNVMSEYFNFDPNLYNKFGKGMSYPTQTSKKVGMRISNIKLSNISESSGLRLSSRANNDIAREIFNVLNNCKLLQIKDVSINVVNGNTPIYSEEGSVPVIKTAHLKSKELSKDFEEFVNEEYALTKHNSLLSGNEILLCNIGKCSCGKIDFNDYDGQAFASSEIMKIIVDENKYNSKFLLYFLRCVLGYYQIERAYTGCTNQIHLYPDDVRNFFIPDIDLKTQIKIVNLLDKKILEQNVIDKSINDLRKNIDDIINLAIS